MPHNFHDTKGLLLVGVDLHQGLHWPVPTQANMVPMNFLEVNCFHPFTMSPGGDRNPTVLINGVESVKWQCSPKLLWPHFPLRPDPLNLTFLLDVAFGTHKCWLPKTNVIAEGTPMAPVCIWAVLSTNLDCFMWTKAPTSLILQPGTVETTPTLGDYGYGLLIAAINLAIDALFRLLTGGFKKKTPVPKGTIARANWGSLKRNLGDFFSGPRAHTLQRTALNRFGKEVASRFIPRKWSTSNQAWAWKSPGAILNWARGKLGAGKYPIGWDEDAGTLGLDWKPTNLWPDPGEPFDLADFAKTFGGNFFPPLKLL
ncbi:MAG: hypothetical protein DRI90_24405 [Deltaproteobacteria bacterium]|nr:MAG: hypothetical protein DRI90_24405 [Deltaproteobacteria bacterium]